MAATTTTRSTTNNLNGSNKEEHRGRQMKPHLYHLHSKHEQQMSKAKKRSTCKTKNIGRRKQHRQPAVTAMILKLSASVVLASGHLERLMHQRDAKLLLWCECFHTPELRIARFRNGNCLGDPLLQMSSATVLVVSRSAPPCSSNQVRNSTLLLCFDIFASLGLLLQLLPESLSTMRTWLKCNNS